MAKRKKYKRTNNDLQNITHTAKDRVASLPPLKTGSKEILRHNNLLYTDFLLFVVWSTRLLL